MESQSVAFALMLACALAKESIALDGGAVLISGWCQTMVFCAARASFIIRSVAFLVFLKSSSVAAQNSGDLASLKKQINELQTGQKEIQKQLEDIRKLLTPPERPVPASLDLSVSDAPFRGNEAAKVTLVEYFDYQCPFCAAFFNDTMPQVLSDYILKSKVRYVVRDFPWTRLTLTRSKRPRRHIVRTIRGSSGVCTMP